MPNTRNILPPKKRKAGVLNKASPQEESQLTARQKARRIAAMRLMKGR